MSRIKDASEMTLEERMFGNYCTNCGEKRADHYVPSKDGVPGAYTCVHVPWAGELTPVSAASTVADTPNSAGD